MTEPTRPAVARRIVLGLIALAGTVATPLAARPHVEAHVHLGGPPGWAGPAYGPGWHGPRAWGPPIVGRGWEEVSRVTHPAAFRDPRFVSWVLWSFDRNRDGRLSRSEGREAARVLWAQQRPDPRWRDARGPAPWEGRDGYRGRGW